MAASDDMVREILVRVKDVTTLFRCAMVCKGWLSLIADDSFIRRYLPENVCRSSSFSGFITQRRGCVQPCFVPAPCCRRVLGTDLRRFLSSLFSGVPASYFDYAVPLASRHGILLLRLEPQHHIVHPDRSGVLLAVCDLLAGTVHELPGLDHYWDFEQGSEVSGYALLTAADFPSSNVHNHDLQQGPRYFKVMIITIQQNRMRYNLHMISAADDSGWSTCSGAVEDDGEGGAVYAMLRQHNAAVVGGAAHWLMWGGTGTHTLHVSAETGHVSSTKMLGIRRDDSRSRVYDKPYLTVDGEGNLTLLSLKRDGCMLEISTSRDNGRSFTTSVLVLKQPCHQQTTGTDHVYTCLGEMCGMMLVKVNNRRVYIADVKTGVMREVPYWPCSNGLSRRKVVPFQINWPFFFAFRIAVDT